MLAPETCFPLIILDWKSTDISSHQHLLCKVFHISLVSSVRSAVAQREDVLQVRLEKAAVPEVGHLDVGVGGNFVVDVDVIVAEAVHDEPAEVGRMAT